MIRFQNEVYENYQIQNVQKIMEIYYKKSALLTLLCDNSNQIQTPI